MKWISHHSKLPNVGETIFTTMSALANQYQAINLSQGFPDFPIDSQLLKCLQQTISENSHQYAPMAGLLELRNQISLQWQKRFFLEIQPDSEITVTSGGTEAIFDAVQAVVNPGDEVIIFEPCYDSYVPAILLAGGIPVSVPLSYPDYRIDFDRLKKNINQRTKAILINTPNNPTGTLIRHEDFLELQTLLDGKNTILISDEVYENIVFDGLEYRSALHYPELRKKSFVIFSFGKSLHVTGWKTGYCIAPENLTVEFRKVHQYVTFCSPHPIQKAILHYMVQNPDYYIGISKMYEKKRDFFLELIKNSRFQPLKCEGTYFQLLSYQGISKEKDVVFAKELTQKHGVASIPVSVFYKNGEDNKVLRFCFAKREETLIYAAERLCKI